jgi:hypothetical protein
VNPTIFLLCDLAAKSAVLDGSARRKPVSAVIKATLAAASATVCAAAASVLASGAVAGLADTKPPGAIIPSLSESFSPPMPKKNTEVYSQEVSYTKWRENGGGSEWSAHNDDERSIDRSLTESAH